MWGNTKDKEPVESKNPAGTFVSETTTAVVDKASQMAQWTQETAVAGKDATGGALLNTGEAIKNAAQSTHENVMNAAQGATENVKNTLGMGGDSITPIKKT
ncbi:hypothetical protein Tco_0702748 [Tanacetum coccineum]|uniref:Uncharacterized protein n=1 Tax=Tanacetum coccineum TaxID=301880 RepID=A0ABQ4XY88_9ASTR